MTLRGGIKLRGTRILLHVRRRQGSRERANWLRRGSIPEVRCFRGGGFGSISPVNGVIAVGSPFALLNADNDVAADSVREGRHVSQNSRLSLITIFVGYLAYSRLLGT